MKSGLSSLMYRDNGLVSLLDQLLPRGSAILRGLHAL